MSFDWKLTPGGGVLLKVSDDLFITFRIVKWKDGKAMGIIKAIAPPRHKGDKWDQLCYSWIEPESLALLADALQRMAKGPQ